MAAHNFPSLPATTSIRWQNLSVSTRNCERQSTSSCKGRGVGQFRQNTEIWRIILTQLDILLAPWACEAEDLPLLSEACLVFVARSVQSCCVRAITGGLA